MSNQCPKCSGFDTEPSIFRGKGVNFCRKCLDWVPSEQSSTASGPAPTENPSPATESENPNVGRKNDADKPAVQYIPMVAIFAEGKAFAAGVKKYGAWNYTKGMAVTRPLGGAIRHIFQFLSGEDYDQETGAHHLGCARANLGMALDILERRPDLDDRPKK